MPHDREILGLKDYEIKDIRRDGRRVVEGMGVEPTTF